MTPVFQNSPEMNLLRALRPNQWTKNGVILTAFVFGIWDKSQDVLFAESLMRIIPGVLLFCLVSSSIYLINDVRDIESDRVHPTKRYRPIAAGLVSQRTALIAAAILLAFTAVCSWILSFHFFLVVAAYVFLQVVYTLFLK